jgi:hypothetical protein
VRVLSAKVNAVHWIAKRIWAPVAPMLWGLLLPISSGHGAGRPQAIV